MLISSLNDLTKLLSDYPAHNTDNEDTLSNTEVNRLEELYSPTKSFKHAVKQARYRIKQDMIAKIIYQNTDRNFLVINLSELPAATQFGGRAVALLNKHNTTVKLTIYKNAQTRQVA